MGIVDSLIASFYRVPGLTVISRQASLPYQDHKKPVAVVARELGATVLVDGSIQSVGERLRVSVSLLRPDSNVVVWSNAYDGTFADIFELQREVAEAVTEALRIRLSPKERQRISEPRTASIEALAEYSQGRSFMERPDVKGNLDRAIDLLAHAASRDPKFASAHAALAEAYWRKYTATHDPSLPTLAGASITEALRLDASDTSVRFALAGMYKETGRVTDAMDELRRVIELQPGRDDAHRMLGQLLSAAGRAEEGIAELKKSISLRPGYWPHYQDLGMAYFSTGRYEEAAAAFRRVTELQPDGAWGFQMLGTCYHARGDLQDALVNYQRAISLGGHSKAYSNLGNVLYSEGRFGEALKAFEEALKQEPRSALAQRNMGDIYQRLGQRERAASFYRRAVELSSEDLKLNPRDASAMSRSAVCLAKLGRTVAALEQAEAAAALAPNNADVLYREAVVLALIGKSDRSVATLQQAVSRGYSSVFARLDDDLASIRNRDAYKRLIAPANGAGGDR